MATNYPTSIDTFTDPTAGQTMQAVSHSAQHDNANDAIHALETFLGTSGSPGPALNGYAGALTPIVLDFPGASTHQNVWHGNFWDTTQTDLGSCLWEALVMVRSLAITGYWMSEGYGGAHAVLAGVTSGQPTGNMQIAGGPVTVNGDYAFTANEWCYYAMGFDGTHVYIWINGVLVGRTAGSGARTAQQGQPFVGGSDHLNWDGRIAAIRGFEGALPFFTGANSPIQTAYRPEIPFLDIASTATNNPPPAAALWEYTTPSKLTIADMSQGYRGRTHPGRLLGTGSGSPANTNYSSFPWPAYTVDATFPWQPSGLVQPTRTVHAPASVPGGAKIFDSFGRQDQLPIWQQSPSLGNTEGGSLGALTWQQNTGGGANPLRWGIFSGMAIEVSDSAQSYAWVSNNSGDMDVRGDNYKNAPLGIRMGLLFRYSSSTNYWYAQVSGGSGTGGGTLAVFKNVSGTRSQVGSNVSLAGSWTTLRVLTSGSNITVYVDNGSGGWTSQLTATDSFNSSATGVGLFSDFNGPDSTSRVQNFTVL